MIHTGDCIEAEARQQDGSALRSAIESAMEVSHAAKHHRMFSACELGECPLARAALAALPPSAPPELDDLMREHRKCGPKYEGCYAHWPMDHCRADGMAWPCDVEHIRARLQEPER